MSYTRKRTKPIISNAGHYTSLKTSVIGSDSMGNTTYTGEMLPVNATRNGISRMTENVPGTVYHPIDHKSVVINYDGYQPPELNNGDPYLNMYYEDPVQGSQLVQFPTRYLVDQVTGLYPRLFSEVNDEEFGWKHRFDGALKRVRDMKPSLNTGFSLVNFLLQWKDVKHILEHYSASGINKRLKTLVKAAKEGPSAFVRNAANEHLEHQYGTLQFFRDMTTILRILRYWKYWADKFAADAGKNRFITVGYREPIRTSFVTELVPLVLTGYTEGAGATFYRVDSVLESKVSLVYRYSIPNMPGFLARAAQLADSFGVSLDPGIVWDAIPFSFVVDWFHNFSEWFHRQRRDWYRADVIYAECGVSTKLTVTRSVYWSRDCQGDINTPIIQYKYVHYAREFTEIPRSYEPAEISNPDKWSIVRKANATALLAQKLLKSQQKIRG